LLSEVLEDTFDPPLHLIMYRARDASPTGFADALQTGGYIDTIAVYGAVRSFDNLTEIDPDAKVHLARFRQSAIPLSELVLNFKGSTHGFRGGLEYSEHAVARHVHDTA